jgi:hypothetical protein
MKCFKTISKNYSCGNKILYMVSGNSNPPLLQSHNQRCGNRMKTATTPPPLAQCTALWEGMGTRGACSSALKICFIKPLKKTFLEKTSKQKSFKQIFSLHF